MSYDNWKLDNDIDSEARNNKLGEYTLDYKVTIYTRSPDVAIPALEGLGCYDYMEIEDDGEGGFVIEATGEYLYNAPFRQDETMLDEVKYSIEAEKVEVMEIGLW